MSVLFSCILAWLLFVVADYNVKKLKKVDPEKKFTKVVLLKTSVSGYLRNFLLIASVSYSALFLVVIAVNILPDHLHNEFLASRLLGTLTTAKSFHESFDAAWKIVGMVFLGLAAIVTLYRVRRKSTRRFMDELVNKYNRDEIENLPDTPEIEELKAEILKDNQELQRLNRLQPMNITKAEELEDKKEGIRQQIRRNYNELKRVDFLRRLESSISEDRGLKEKRTLWCSTVLFFTSAGMYTTIKGVEKMLSSASTVFLLFSLLTVQSAQLTASTTTGEMQLEAIVVGQHVNELDARFAGKLLSKATPLDKDDKETLSKFSQALEHEIMRSYVTDSAQISRQQNFYFIATEIRQEVLQRYVKQKADAGDPHNYFASEPFSDVRDQGASEPAARFAESYHAETNPGAARSTFRKKLNEELTYVVERLPKQERISVMTKIRNYLESFQKPVEIPDILDMLYEHLYDPTMGDAAKDILDKMVGSEDLAEKMFSQAASSSFSKVFDQTFEFKTKNVMASMVFDHASVDAAIGRIHHFNIDLGTTIPDQIKTVYASADPQPKVLTIMDGLKKAPPTMTYNYISDQQATSITRQLNDYADGQSENVIRVLLGKYNSPEAASYFNAHADEIKKYYADKIKQSYSSGLSGYEDYFPSRLSGESATVYAREVEPVLAPAGNAIASAASEDLFADAFNFVSLLGNQRIGGVLIGRAPEARGNATLDLRQISWTSTGSLMDISVADRAGHQITLGRFDPDVIAQSIAYAADGRPVATTMISIADGVPLKVMVHPSLVNTPLGCKVINLDRFVDTYATSNPTGVVPLCLNTYNCADQLYQAVAYDVIFEKSLVADSVKSRISEDVADYRDGIRQYYLEIKAILRDGKMLDDTLYTPMRYKKDYYNQQLVNAMIADLKNNDIQDGDAFLSTLESQISNLTTAAELLVTNGQVWSGVREQPYQLTADLAAFRYQKGQDPFKTLSFIEQVAYSRSLFTADDTSADFHPERDSSPWEFLYLKKSGIIQSAIAENLHTGSNDEIINKAVEFVILQRLFRNGFQGNLGLQFPVNRLADLMNACVPEVSYVKTAEWSSIIRQPQTKLKKSEKDFMKLVGILGINNKENAEACH